MTKRIVFMVFLVLISLKQAVAQDAGGNIIIHTSCDGRHWVDMRTKIDPYPRSSSTKNVLADGFKSPHPLKDVAKIEIGVGLVLAARGKKIFLTQTTH